MSVNNYPNPYKGSCQLTIYASAEMLESIAGYPDDERIDRELRFALHDADMDSADTLRWLAALLEVKLGDHPNNPPSFQDEAELSV